MMWEIPNRKYAHSFQHTRREVAQRRGPEARPVAEPPDEEQTGWQQPRDPESLASALDDQASLAHLRVEAFMDARILHIFTDPPQEV